MTGYDARALSEGQGARTYLDSFAGRLGFVIEISDSMLMYALNNTATILAPGLKTLVPGCTITREIVAAV